MADTAAASRVRSGMPSQVGESSRRLLAALEAARTASGRTRTRLLAASAPCRHAAAHHSCVAAMRAAVPQGRQALAMTVACHMHARYR